jgi:hypothetical protein
VKSPSIALQSILSLEQPLHLRCADLEQLERIEADSFRRIRHNGRDGLNSKRLHGRLVIPRHNLNAERGSMSVWFCMLEDISCCLNRNEHREHNPDAARYDILSSDPRGRSAEASFSLTQEAFWAHQFYVKFGKGIFLDQYIPEQKGFASAGHLATHRLQWYCATVTWDKPASELRLYLNGHLVGISDAFARKFAQQLIFEEVNGPLFAGNPAVVVSEVVFTGAVLPAETVRAHYLQGATDFNPTVDQELEDIYGGGVRRPFRFSPSSEWRESFAAALNSPADLQQFHIQGNQESHQLTEEGLLIETPQHQPSHTKLTNEHMYLWTERFFEGDLYLEYDFMPLQEGGLSLLMTQACGMQGEDFMREYPRRTGGSMSMVCWEDVRNYHWEYYRQMNDVRNDKISHILMKNPWFRPMGMATRDGQYAIGTWHRLQFLQTGRNIRCAVNGDLLLDLEDDPYQNNGPVYNCGRIAIRVMVRSKLQFRNFRVCNRPQFEHTPLA